MVGTHSVGGESRKRQNQSGAPFASCLPLETFFSFFFLCDPGNPLMSPILKQVRGPGDRQAAQGTPLHFLARMSLS